MPEEKSDRDKARRPQPGGKKIQPQKALPADGAQAQCKRREIAHAVDEAERQDKAGIVALQPMERGIDAMPPARKPVKQPNAETPAKPEIAFAAADAAGACCR